MKKFSSTCISIFVVSCFVVLPLSCSQSEYSRLVKNEMSKDIMNDSLLFGMKFGQSRQTFFDICWQLNNKGLIKQGPENKFVQYQLPIPENDSTAKKVMMYFYGIFNEEKIMTGMDLKFGYNSWSLWNKSYQADTLLPQVKDSLLKWFPGNDFISVPLKKNGEAVLVKIDGNRRILIEPLENNKDVNARIDDLRYLID